MKPLAVKILEKLSEIFEYKLLTDEKFASEFLDRAFKDRIDEKASSSNTTGNQPWANDAEFQEIDNLKPNSKDEEETARLDSLLKKMIDKYVAPLKKKLENSLKRVATKDSKIIVGIKSIDSIKSKMLRGRKVASMGDILRAAILVKNDKDAETTIKNMKNIFNLYQVEDKERGSDPEWGYYGSHHYDIDFNGVICEVQIMTKRLWTYKEVGHTYYDKWRNYQKSNPSVKNTPDYKKDSRISKMVFDQGNGRRRSGLRIG